MSLSLRSDLKALVCPILGIPKELEKTYLPRNGEILRYWRLLANIEEKPGKIPSRYELVTRIATEVHGIWKSASIPSIGIRTIEKKVNSMIDRYISIKKSYVRDGNLPKFKAKLANFESLLIQLFDAAACKCHIFDTCRCKKDAKVPKVERAFLNDQRGLRKMIIAGIDPTLTGRLVKKLARRKALSKESAGSDKESQEAVMKRSYTSQNDESEINVDNGNVEDYVTDPCFIGPDEEEKTSEYNTNKMENLAVACERTGVSSRCAAILTNAVLEDVGLINPNSSNDVTDRNKITRQRKRSRSYHLEAAAKCIESNHSIGMYFDGKKHETLTLVTKGAVKARKLTSEEHYTIILEPNTIYKAYVTPRTGSAKNVTSALLDEMGTLMDGIKVVGCDGTNVNTGNKGGVITLLEGNAQKPLQWCICLLHMNELPLRHLIKSIDSETTGPKSFTGDLGKLLGKVESMPVVEFQVIPSEPLCVTPNDLSTDQCYMYHMYEAICTGRLDASLSNRDPGNISHSRWLTTANRFLRLYVSTSEPSENLVKIVRYIMKCYIPTWFSIKYHESLVFGSNNLFGLIKRCKTLDDSTKKIVYPVIQNNGYFAHSECILLSMIVDHDTNLRKLALSRIIKARGSEDSHTKRKFRMPEINFNAEHYGDMIMWKSEYIDDEVSEEPRYLTLYTEPPVLSGLSEDLHHVVQEGKLPDSIYNLPSHNQRVERAIKLVSQTSQKSAKKEEREGIIQTVIASRSKMPKLETKKQFRVKWNLHRAREGK